jgi:hypothetical protein
MPLTIPAALRSAPTHPLDLSLIRECIYSGDPKLRHAEDQFKHALTHGLSTLPSPTRSPLLNGVTGLVAESVAATVLESKGWAIFGQTTDPYPSRHGVDLLALSPSDKVFAIEVKGTLQAARWPRFRASELGQMTATWLNKPDNPLMNEWGLTGLEVYGMVLLLHFGKNLWKGIITEDYIHGRPVTNLKRY